LPIAWRSSLSETLVTLTAVGVPDIYQGAERWDTRLTDPDNRNPVPFDELARLLERAKRASPEEALAGLADGIPKLWLIQRVLATRASHPEWFGAEAPYRPIAVDGAQADRIVAFSRGERVVVVAPRLWGHIMKLGFGDTRLTLPAVPFRNVLDQDARYDGTVSLGQMLSRFPVALLIAENQP
jgi:(1->4)-alpha-D-glucan 1-alpha-D-glucosylmutase